MLTKLEAVNPESAEPSRAAAGPPLREGQSPWQVRGPQGKPVGWKPRQGLMLPP